MSLILFFLGLFLSALIGYVYISMRFGTLRQHARLLIKQAEIEADTKRHEGELQLLEHKNSLHKEETKLKNQKEHCSLLQKQIQHEQERIKKDRSKIVHDKKELIEKLKTVEQSHAQSLQTLEKISLLSEQEARTELFLRVEQQIQTELAQKKKELSEQAEQEATLTAQTILVSAIERVSHSSTKEHSITQVPISSQILIPRLIGKGGRNIQMLEQVLDVALTLEQNPACLTISSHDPKRRYLASMTIEILLKNEKITPVIVREVHEKTLQQLETQVVEEGRQACLKSSIDLPPTEVLALLGSLLFRSSAGQNTLKHSIEVSELMGMVAERMQLNAALARSMGLFHDIGKALSTEWGSSHATAGKKFLEQFDVDPSIINGVASHHQEEPTDSLEARLLPVCDKISAQLPGVRHSSAPTFLSIVHECEALAKAVPHVSSAWAHYAGNHIELLVRPDREIAALDESIQTALTSSLQIKLPVTITLLPLTMD